MVHGHAAPVLPLHHDLQHRVAASEPDAHEVVAQPLQGGLHEVGHALRGGIVGYGYGRRSSPNEKRRPEAPNSLPTVKNEQPASTTSRQARGI